MEKKKSLEVGEEYLNVQISIGNAKFNLPAFKNKDKKPGSNEPDYKAQNIAIWVSSKKAKDNFDGE